MFTFLYPTESKPTTPPEEENMYANLSSEKLLQFNIILQELNHKMGKQNFKMDLS